MPIEKTTLSNGVTVLSETVEHVGSASIGLWCRTGSADELEDEAGITHLIEHMLFKGTEKRTARQIAEEIEGRGGSLNAFTNKESTCYYCRVLAEEAENGLDVLADMMTSSKFAPDDLRLEIDVVLEEIRRGEDEPGDHVHDLHLQHRWKGHALGLPIIGTRESVSGFVREDLIRYMDRRYRGDNILVACAGNVAHEDLVKWADGRLGSLPAGGERNTHLPPVGLPETHAEKKEVEQVHFCIGGDAPSSTSEERYAMGVLDTIMGGGMSSRLFQVIREERGLAYAVGSYTLSYEAGGAYTIYGGTSPSKWPLVRDLVDQEARKAMGEPVSAKELESTKANIVGSLVLKQESMPSRMIRMATNEFVHGRNVPLDETIEKVRAVTAADVQARAAESLDPVRLSITTIGPTA